MRLDMRQLVAHALCETLRVHRAGMGAVILLVMSQYLSAQVRDSNLGIVNGTESKPDSTIPSNGVWFVPSSVKSECWTSC